MVELENEKLTLLRSRCASKPQDKQAQAAAMSKRRSTFLIFQKHDRVQQTIPVTFPRRGVYRQEAFRSSLVSPWLPAESAPA